jgi:RHS repeat-associated protein
MNRHSAPYQPTNPFLSQSDVYRYGFNGKESDSQIKGQGLSLDFGARFLDTRIGRWWKTDPAHWKQPHQSLYQSQRNNPIIYTDPNGETEYLTIVVTDFEGNSIMYRKVLSEDVMTDGKRHFESHFLFGKPYGGHYETRYYDLERIYTYSLDGSGNLHECGVQTKILFENGVKDDDLVFTIGEQDKYGDTKDPDGINSTAPYQNIGIYFISNEGGGDQTRTREESNLAR